jgi:hypothetical protein
LAIAICATSIVAAATSTSTAHDRGVVMFVGDSNITIASGALMWGTTWGTHHDNSYTPVFAPRVGAGIRTPDCAPAVTPCTTSDFWKTKLGEILPKVNVDAVVTDLGINDTAALGTRTSLGYSYYGQKIDWFMRLIPADRPVFWTNLPCAIEPSSRRTGCQYVNASLANARLRWPNLIVLNWGAAANSHPEYMASPGIDIHYSARGSGTWAGFVVAALDARFPIPP